MTQQEWESVLIPGAKFEARELTKEEVDKMIAIIEEYEAKQESIRRYWSEHYWELTHRPMDF